MNPLLSPIIDPSLLVYSSEKEKKENPGTKAFFQYEFVNCEDVYNHQGFTITPEGDVYLFDKVTQWTFAENSFISRDNLLKNLDASVRKSIFIPKEELQKYQKMVNNIVNSKLSESIVKGKDNGCIIKKVIIPDTADSSKFREYLVSQSGDIEIQNLDPAAEVISKWLNKIWQKILS